MQTGKGRVAVQRLGWASQQGEQSLRHRLVENRVIERVKQLLTISPAGKKIADIAVDAGTRDA